METPEVPNPFQATFPPSAPASQPLPPEESTQSPTHPLPTPESGKNGRKNRGSAKSTRSTPITRPRKAAVKKAKKKPGRKPKSDRAAVDAAPVPAIAQHATPIGVPKKLRKPRAGKAERSIKIDLSHAMTAFAGIKAEDAVLLSQMVGELQKRGKPARKRIVAALGRIFQ